jgi:putative PIN family toxin of toxin-antitoxin system
MLCVVIDTSVLVSALISNGKPRELLKRGLENEFSIVTSDLILKELATVLRRPQFKTSEAEINAIILALKRSARVVNVKSKLKAVKEDPKDEAIVCTAYDGHADVIVTGDSHLLNLRSLRGISIITVKNALEML